MEWCAPSPFDILVSDKISAVVTAALLEGGLVASRVGAGEIPSVGRSSYGQLPLYRGRTCRAD